MSEFRVDIIENLKAVKKDINKNIQRLDDQSVTKELVSEILACQGEAIYTLADTIQSILEVL